MFYRRMFLIFFLFSFCMELCLATETKKYLEREGLRYLKFEDIFYPSKLLPKDFTFSLKDDDAYLEKAKSIIAIVGRISSSIDVSFDDISRMIQTVEYIRTKYKINKNKRSIYLQKERGYTPFSVQIYSNGRVYILFDDQDPKAVKGGYKFFSRCLDIDDGVMYATLVTPISGKRSVDKMIKELLIMEDMKLFNNNLSYENFDVFTTLESKRPVNKLIMQTVLYDHDLSYLKNHYAIPFRDYLRYFRLAVDAVIQLHKAKYIHRDIKPKNFFIRGRGKNIKLTLADYGLSQHIDDAKFGLKSAGSKGFIAPEICHSKFIYGYAFKNFSSGVRSDIFALGMTFYSILEKENKLTKILFGMNYLLFSGRQNKTKGEMLNEFNKFNDRLESIYASGVLDFEVLKSTTNRIENCKQALRMVIWKMLNPINNKRISLLEVDEKLRNILEYYEGSRKTLDTEFSWILASI